jgi:hypothetical protein
MPSIPVNTSVDAPVDGVNPMDTTPPNSGHLAIEFSSPFYLNHDDSLGTLLVSKPLVGNNYHT